MKGDVKVKELIRNIKSLAETWDSYPNQCSATDRIAEEIVLKAKELEEIHEGRFKEWMV